MRWAVRDAARFVQRLVGVHPLKGMGHRLIIVRQEALQLLFQIGHRGEIPSSNHLSHDDPKHRFDLVQPGTVFGQEHEANAMFGIRQERTSTRLVVQHARLPLFSPAADAARNAGRSIPPVPPTSEYSGRRR